MENRIIKGRGAYEGVMEGEADGPAIFIPLLWPDISPLHGSSKNWIPAALPVLWNWAYLQSWRLRKKPVRSFMTETISVWMAIRES